MRVLVVGEFDCCDVAAGWRDALKPLGLDLRVCSQRLYRPGERPDFWLDSTICDHGALYEFARSADLLVICPAIGQQWSYLPPLEFRRGREPDDVNLGGIDWDSMPGKKLALFHGSLLLSAHAESYADLYRDKGYAVAATTLDYVLRMRARYMPPVVTVPEGLRARPRRDDEGLHIIHAPTSRNVCQSDEFEFMCSSAGMVLARPGFRMPAGLDVVVTPPGRMHWADLMRLKAAHNAGYDHVRGAFSINSVENAALGLVNLVGVRPACREWMRANMGARPPWPDAETMGDLDETIGMLRDSPAMTRKYQDAGRGWYVEKWAPEIIAKWVARQIEEVARA